MDLRLLISLLFMVSMIKYSTSIYISSKQPEKNRRPSTNPINLENDTFVNYINPRPTIDPDAEVIGVEKTPNVRMNPEVTTKVSLTGDLNVNYLNPRPTIDPEAEVFRNEEKNQSHLANLEVVRESSSNDEKYPINSDSTVSLGSHTEVNNKTPGPQVNLNEAFAVQKILIFLGQLDSNVTKFGV